MRIGGRARWFHGYCDLAKASAPERMRTDIVKRESRPVHAMSRQEKLDHIWSVTGTDFRAYADLRFPPSLRERRIIVVFKAPQAKLWKRLDDLTDEEITAKLPVQFRHLPETVSL